MLPRFSNICERNVNSCIVFFSKFSSKAEKPTYIRIERDDEKPEAYSKPARIQIIKAHRSQFNFYKGQTFPKFQRLPLASQGWMSKDSKGDYFTIYPLQDEKKIEPVDEEDRDRFEDFGLHDELVSNVKNYLNLNYPTDIQVKGITKILNGDNIKLAAETGCGKTLAYLLPLVHQVINWKSTFYRRFNRPLALIITPSTELAIQIGKVAKILTRDLDVRTRVITGGSIRKKIFNPPINEVDIIIATIGGLSKHLTFKVYKTKFIRHVILDEADCLFDETFYEKLRHVLRKISFGPISGFENYLPKYSQLTLVSATMPQFLDEIFEDIIDPESLTEVTTEKLHQVHVKQKFFRLGAQEKPMALLKLVKFKGKGKSVIVFCNNGANCEWLVNFLQEFEVKCVHLSGQLNHKERKESIAEFQRGTYNVLCTTDAGGRGLDTTAVKDIINYDFPLQTAEYIHRCGRTGRIGSPKDCQVVNFITRPLEILLTQKIEQCVRLSKPIPIVDYLKRNWSTVKGSEEGLSENSKFDKKDVSDSDEEFEKEARVMC